jgi:ParB family transcriptional regulator, chromosome partitioning protein
MKTVEEKVELIPLSDIKVARQNIRTTFDDEKLRELADSIKERGVLQPIICRRTNGKLELIAGERRWRASKIAGLRQIPAIVREANDDEVTYDQIIENLQREDLSVEDQFRALKALKDSGLTIPRISKMTGLSTTSIQRVLVLDTLKPAIRKREDLSAYAKAFIARAPEPVQNLLADRIAKEEIGTKQLGHDVMPAIAEALEEEAFDEQEKRRVVEKIVREASIDRPGRAIVRQERGKKKLQSLGVDVEIASNQSLKELLDLSQKYRDNLVALQAARFDHLDPRLVIGLIDLFRQIHGALEEILESVAIARRRK